MADGRITDYTRTTVVSGNVIDPADENTNRTNIATSVNNANDVLIDLEQNYANSSAPTSIVAGKLWYSTEGGQAFMWARISSAWKLLAFDGMTTAFTFGDGLTVASNFAVSGAAVFGDTLTVSGAARFDSGVETNTLTTNVAIEGTLTVSGAASLQSTLTVTGAATLESFTCASDGAVSNTLRVGTGTIYATLDASISSDNAFSAATDSWHTLAIRNSSENASNAAGLVFFVNDTPFGNAGSGIAAVKTTTSGDYGTDLVVVTRPEAAAAAERMRFFSSGTIYAANDFGIGTTEPSVELVVSDSTNPIGMLHRNSTLGDGNAGGKFQFAGNDGTSNQQAGAQIWGLAKGAWSNSSHPMELGFFTVPSGSTTLTEAMQIKSTGTVHALMDFVVSGAATIPDLTTTSSAVMTALPCIVWRLVNDVAGTVATLGSGGSDWEIADDTKNEFYLGPSTSVTENSGIFSFGTTGYWRVDFHGNWGAGDGVQVLVNCQSTEDNSAYSTVSSANAHNAAAASNQHLGISAVLKVDDVSNDKVKFSTSASATTGALQGSGTQSQTYIVFNKLSDL